MESSVDTVKVGEEVTITVTVSGTEQTAGRPIGVFLVTALASTGSIPSDSGWTIISDPNGGTNNYVEVVADADGGGVYEWKLKAPSAGGEHTFYSREDHGNGFKYYQDYKAGVAITVDDPNANPDVPSGDGDGGGDDNDGSGSPSGNVSGKDKETSGDVITGEPDVVPLLLGLVVATFIVVLFHLMRQ